MHAYIHTYTYIIYIYIYMDLFIHKYTCIYIYIYVYIHTHRYTVIYIYLVPFVLGNFDPSKTRIGSSTCSVLLQPHVLGADAERRQHACYAVMSNIIACSHRISMFRAAAYALFSTNIYIYIYIHIHTYIYIYRERERDV